MYLIALVQGFRQGGVVSSRTRPLRMMTFGRFFFFFLMANCNVGGALSPTFDHDCRPPKCLPACLLAWLHPSIRLQAGILHILNFWNTGLHCVQIHGHIYLLALKSGYAWNKLCATCCLTVSKGKCICSLQSKAGQKGWSHRVEGDAMNRTNGDNCAPFRTVSFLGCCTRLHTKRGGSNCVRNEKRELISKDKLKSCVPFDLHTPAWSGRACRIVLHLKYTDALMLLLTTVFFQLSKCSKVSQSQEE